MVLARIKFWWIRFSILDLMYGYSKVNFWFLLDSWNRNDKFLIIDQTYQSLSFFTLHHSRNQILEAFFYKLTRILSILHPLTYTSPFCVRYARCSMNGINFAALYVAFHRCSRIYANSYAFLFSLLQALGGCSLLVLYGKRDC